jgi:O-antigen/teichoic acid export membrane protein
MKYFFDILQKKSTSVFSILDQAIVSGSNFIVMFTLARFLSPNEYGAYVLSFTVLLFINGIQMALSTTPLNVRGASLNENDLRYYIQSLLIFNVLCGVLITIILIISLLIMKVFYVDRVIIRTFSGLSLSLFFIQIQEFFKRVLYFSLKVKEVFFIDAISNSILIFGIVMFYNLKILNSLSIYLLIGFVSLFSIALFFPKIYIYLRKPYTKLSIISKSISWNIQYGKWTLGSHLLYWIGNQTYLFTATIYLSVVATAKIAATQNLVNAVNVLVMGIQNIAMPIASRKLHKQGLFALKQYIKYLIFLIILSVGLYGFILTVFGDRLMELLYNNKYSNVSILMMLWSISFLIASINRMFMIFLNAVEKNRINFYIYLFNAILSLGFIIPITKTFEIFGMAVWTIISSTIMLLVNVIVFTQENQIKHKKFKVGKESS